MPLPTKDQISTAIENPRNILDPILDGFSTEEGIVGPLSYSGGFCIVYPITDGSSKYALRLWHTEIEGIKDRIKKISKYLATKNLPYFVDFQYVDAALRVPSINGIAQVVDAIRMQWINGLNLVEYINSVITDPLLSPVEKKQKLYKLADSFAQMVSDLHENNISHGDLQHGNIIITDSGDIKLVDYDSVYVPTFTDEKQVTSGLSSYQHPCRKGSGRKASPEDDYFSELVICLSILCIADDFSLWVPFDERNEHVLLFSDKDYRDLTNCSVYNIVKNNSNSKIQRLLSKLVEYLNTNNLDSFEPLENILKSSYLSQPASISLDEDDMDIISSNRTKIKTKKLPVNIPHIDKDAAIKKYKNN